VFSAVGGPGVRQGGGTAPNWPWQIPPDLVVKSQPTDIIDPLLELIKRQNGVHMTCSNRKSRGELLSTAEGQWSTTKSDGMCGGPLSSTTETSPDPGLDGGW
jgi:hypothetical protein